VIAVPQRFLQWHNGKPGVFIAKGSKAMWRDVTLGLRGREMVEVTHGLSAGDRVVAIAEAKEPPLKSGQRVTGK
jgi:HlyD family secretion protein